MSSPLDLLPCGYVSFTDAGIMTSCNSTLVSWLGYSKEELVDKKFEHLLTLASRVFYNTHFFPLIKLHSSTSEIFLSLKGKDERVVPVLANAKRLVDESGHVIHCALIRVEERSKYEEELLRARREAENALKQNKELADLTKSLEQHALELDKQYQHQTIMNENLVQFSKIISHDLQEPIRKIQVFIDQIARDTETTLGSKSKTLSKKIEEAVHRLKTLTTNLQEYVAIDNEKLFTEVDLNVAIETAKLRATNFRQFSDFGIVVDSSHSIEGYPKQLELLFFHLIDNAIQFRNPDRRLVIKVSYLLLEENIFRISKDRYQYAEHIRISFEDNGMGFSPEYRDYVFQLFKKLDKITPGLGIGLSLVKKIVQNHYGEIVVSSEPGTGTRFEIQLPTKLKY